MLLGYVARVCCKSVMLGCVDGGCELIAWSQTVDGSRRRGQQGGTCGNG